MDFSQTEAEQRARRMHEPVRWLWGVRANNLGWIIVGTIIVILIVSTDWAEALNRWISPW